MMARNTRAILSAYALGVWIAAPRPVDAASCAELTSLVRLSGTTVTLAEEVTAGGFTPPGGGRAGTPPAPYTDLPAFCRVALTVRPVPGSSIGIEVWMPLAGWNGRLDALGGQGWAGTIGYAAMRAVLRRGYAVVATDSGHTTPGGRFAMEPEPLVDFAHRSTHEMAVKAKAIVQAFYGTGPRAAFFDGCSTGGRMALTAAQRYPADFDGIIAGAPANYSSHQAAQMMSVALAVHKSEASYIPPAKYAVLHRAVLQACDARDGVTDGVLENPFACSFDPKVLECTAGDEPGCLTAPQVAAARAIYAPVVNPRTQKEIFPGLAPGSEPGWGVVAGPRPLEFPIEIYRYAVFRNPDWDHRTLDLAADVATAEKANGGILDAVDPDLGAFFRRGGKLLQYHGWSDQAVAPRNSIDYYQSVTTRLGGPLRCAIPIGCSWSLGWRIAAAAMAPARSMRWRRSSDGSRAGTPPTPSRPRASSTVP